MAKIKNNLKIHGKVGDLVFYELNGKDIARKNNAPTKEMHDHAPEFALVRKLNKEFGGGSTGSKFIRDGLKEVLDMMATKDLNNRLTGRLRKIIGSEEGEKGRRPLKFLERKNMLTGLQIDSKTSVRFRLEKSVKRAEKGIEVSWSARASSSSLKLPQSKGTHVRFYIVAMVVSDLVFNEEKDKYQPNNVLLSGKKVIHYSDYLPLKKEPVETTKKCYLEAQGLTDEGIMIFAGVAFYKQEGNNFYNHFTGNCLEINDVVKVEG